MTKPIPAAAPSPLPLEPDLRPIAQAPAGYRVSLKAPPEIEKADPIDEDTMDRWRSWHTR